ncbi:MAG: hypothetical protein IJ724_14130 [Muribaculaceae bacterium]|nr:hypothetical protein [Muribaculaceae bacterium]MBR1727752.1 hypothetical protein [Muribaculaceae bacterium]
MEEPFQSNPPIEYRIVNREQVFHYWFVEPFCNCWMSPVWNKLYRRELIGGERFANVVPAEDREFNTRLYLKCSCAVVINQVLHHYFQRQGSIIDRSEQNFNETTDASHALVVLNSMEPIGFHLGAMTEKERGFFYIRYMKCYLLARLLIKHKSEVQPLLSSFKADVKTHFFSDATIPLIYKTVMGVMFFIPITYYVFLRVNEWRVRFMKKITH